MRGRAPRLLPASLLLAAAALCAASAARPLGWTPRPDSIPPLLAQPDAEPVVAHCSGCHSLDYLSTQPRGKGAQFWRDAVNKMIHVYGAPIAPGEVEGLTAILDARFGTPG
ncbi:MAG: cytochrome C [Sphingobium sp.]